MIRRHIFAPTAPSTTARHRKSTVATDESTIGENLPVISATASTPFRRTRARSHWRILNWRISMAYLCIRCKFISASQETFDKHIREQHDQEIYFCPDCPDYYSEAQEMFRRHRRDFHGRKPKSIQFRQTWPAGTWLRQKPPHPRRDRPRQQHGSSQVIAESELTMKDPVRAQDSS
jgi:hypothetical protein